MRRRRRNIITFIFALYHLWRWWWLMILLKTLHSILSILTSNCLTFFLTLLQTFQEVGSNFLKECISIKGQFSSFMSQNRFRKVTACWIQYIQKGVEKTDLTSFSGKPIMLSCHQLVNSRLPMPMENPRDITTVSLLSRTKSKPQNILEQKENNFTRVWSYC